MRLLTLPLLRLFLTGHLRPILAALSLTPALVATVFALSFSGGLIAHNTGIFPWLMLGASLMLAWRLHEPLHAPSNDSEQAAFITRWLHLDTARVEAMPHWLAHWAEREADKVRLQAQAAFEAPLQKLVRS